MSYKPLKGPHHTKTLAPKAKKALKEFEQAVRDDENAAMGTQTTERVQFRLIQMPCCQYLFCNVNHRWPTYCPNCGQYVFDKVKSCALISDPDATLNYNPEKRT